ncbi:MAG: hypothetical protein IVW56_09505 [Candidatus Binataceae bacterium]|nr:hypothetical protein [Candidatus Binataceae bacterium]
MKGRLRRLFDLACIAVVSLWLLLLLAVCTVVLLVAWVLRPLLHPCRAWRP